MVQTLVIGEHRTVLKIFGNVLHVIEGKVDEKNLYPFQAADFRFALGSMTPNSAEDLGEAIILEKRAYLSHVINGKLKTKEESVFKSPFLMGIDEAQILGALIHAEPTPSAPLRDLYGEMAKRFPFGFAMLGTALFAECRTTYLKKAPTSHENINEHAEKYWAKEEKKKDQEIIT